MKTFRLRGYKYKKYFTVIIHDTVKQMREEADRYEKKPGNNKDILGCCHPFERKRISKAGRVIKIHPHIGIIRLAKPKLHTHIVVHEVVHAAFWQYRLSLPSKYEEKADFGNACSKYEEKFAHLFSRLYLDMIRKMYKHKLW